MRKLIFMSITLIISFYFIGQIYSQDYDIDKSFDKFTEDSIYFMYGNGLEGGSFIGMLHCGFNIMKFKHKDKTETYRIEISLTTAKNFSIKDGTLGSSLYIKSDTTIYDFKAFNVSYKPAQGFYLNNASYMTDKNFLLLLVNSKSVMIRITGLDNSYYNFSFGKDNFINLKDFLKKY